MVGGVSAKDTEDDDNVADGKNAVERDLLALVHLQIPAQHSGECCGESVLMDDQSSNSVQIAICLLVSSRGFHLRRSQLPRLDIRSDTSLMRS